MTIRFPYNFFGGRTTFFALLILGATIYLADRGRVTTEVVALIGIVQGLAVYRATKQDVALNTNGGKS